MKVFGGRWGPALDDPSLMVAVPAGRVCTHCDEPIGELDEGVLLPCLHIGSDRKPCSTEEAMHRECFIRGVTGSIGHQLGMCSCHGGTLEDPVTKRQAARAAVALYERDMAARERAEQPPDFFKH